MATDIQDLVAQNAPGMNDEDEQSQDTPDDSTTTAATSSNSAQTTSPSKQQQRNFVNEIEDLSNNKAYDQPGQPSHKTMLDAIQRAKDMYNENSTRADWSEVAEIIGRAAAKLGAATAGLHSNMDLSQLDMGKPIDWEARRAGYRQEYRNDADLAAKQYEIDRQTALDEGRATNSNYAKKEQFLQTALKQQNEQARENKYQSRLGEQDKRMELTDLAGQQRELQKKLQAVQTVANDQDLLTNADVGNKDNKKIQEKLSSVAAAGGIDTGALQKELEATDKPGKLWGTNPDPIARKQVMDNHVQEIKTMLDAINDRRQQLLGARGQATPVAPPTTNPPAANPDTGPASVQAGPAPEATNTPPPPKPGDIRDGHKYLGGNPADPKSWQQVGN